MPKAGSPVSQQPSDLQTQILSFRRRGLPEALWGPGALDSNSDSASPAPCLTLVFPPSWQDLGGVAGLSPWRQSSPASRAPGYQASRSPSSIPDESYKFLEG